MDELALRLQGTGVEDGQLTFTGIHRITGALQLLATRIGRTLIGQEGPGRSPLAVENATELRLRGLLRGSTVLDVAVGEDQVLGEGLEHQTVDQLFELFNGLATDTPPPWTTPAIGNAMVQVVDALTAVSERCELTSPGRIPVPVRPRSASRSVWPTEDGDTRTQADVSVSGRLDLVDLRRARFRIRDAVGNDIVLLEVANVDDAAQLVGQPVTALGEGDLGARGQILAVKGARVTPTGVLTWTPPVVAIGDATLPPVGGLTGVTAAEVDEFLASIQE
ncbi:MAG: hypothetical protein ACRDRH_04170 [Pseudonocardia sp.]